jgi:hypothetical protein
MEHGLSVYFKYYTEADEKTYGVIALQFELVNPPAKLGNYTKNELIKICKKRKIKRYSSKTKKGLIDLIKKQNP